MLSRFLYRPDSLDATYPRHREIQEPAVADDSRVGCHALPVRIIVGRHNREFNPKQEWSRVMTEIDGMILHLKLRPRRYRILGSHKPFPGRDKRSTTIDMNMIHFRIMYV